MTDRPILDADAPETHRIATLDIIRGVAVMGILVSNLPGFALPDAAYFSPAAWGGRSGADLVAWFATFVLIEGKMRGLFSFLFGASMLLVIDGARRAGRNETTVHFSRMTWLFLIGLGHLYFLWWGDILAHYALVGCLAYPLVGLRSRWLIPIGILLIALQTMIGAGVHDAAIAAHGQNTAAEIAAWRNLALGFGTPPASQIAAEIAANGGGYMAALRWRWATATDPVTALPFIAPETLAYMCFGMAALRSGFLTGAWPRRRYRTIAIASLGLSLPLYGALGLHSIATGFDPCAIILGSLYASTPLRPLAIIGYAALVILALPPGTRLADRVAATGRTAFSNYLGTTIVCTTLFYGLGLFGRLSRAELYLVAPALWAMMLLWSAPWLAANRYGPFEWLWRSLARLEWVPMARKNATNR